MELHLCQDCDVYKQLTELFPKAIDKHNTLIFVSNLKFDIDVAIRFEISMQNKNVKQLNR